MKALAAAILALALGAGPAVAAPEVFTLDPENTWVHFEVLHFGTATIRGRFGPVTGAVSIDREAGLGEVGLRIATATVSTGVRVLDARLREPDLLDSAGNPEAFFVATKLRFEGRLLAELRGEFTLRGTSQPLTLRAMRFGCRDDSPRAEEVCGGDFEGQIKRSDYGASFGLPFIADAVRLQIQVEGRRPIRPKD